MAFQNLGAIAGSIIAPVASYTAGTRVFGPETLPAGFSNVLVLLDLRSCDSLTASVDYAIQYSIDGGSNWIDAGGGGIDMAESGYTLNQGVLTNKEGGPVRMVGGRRFLPRTDLSRQVRMQFTLNETMILGVTVVGF